MSRQDLRRIQPSRAVKRSGEFPDNSGISSTKILKTKDRKQNLDEKTTSKTPVKSKAKNKKSCDHGGSAHAHDHNHEEYDEHSNMDVKKWDTYWSSNGSEGEHNNSPHECLYIYRKHIGLGGPPIKICVPLCGKSHDMLFFANHGHEVIGIEYAKSAIIQFYKMHDIPFDVIEIPDFKGKLYKSKNPRLNLKIYHCDIFNFSSSIETGFDFVWDAGAMHYLKQQEVQPYINIMKTTLGTDCNYMVEFCVPSCSETMTREKLEQLFGKGYYVSDLGTCKTKMKCYKKWGTKGFHMFQVAKGNKPRIY